MKIGDVFKDEKRDIVVIDKKFSKKNSAGRNEYVYKYKCNICGFDCGEHYKKGEYREELWVSGATILKNRCSCCANHSIVTDINSAWKLAPWLIKLGVDENFAKRYSVCGGGEKVKVICPHCKTKKYSKISNIYDRKTIGCTCGDGRSYLSKYIISVLKQINAQYKTEVVYDWNKYINPKNNKLTQAYIDFIIYKDDRKIPLEADGGFHRKDNNMSGMTAEMHKYIDKQRDGNCLKYLGEETIRISDEGNIKENVLNSKLSLVFDLSKIDWLKCEEFALKNIVKEVCDKYKEGDDVLKICKDFDISDTTVRNYIRKGNEIGWVEYLPITGSKKISVWEKDELIGVFKSINDFSTRSVEIVGFYIENKNIARRLNKENKLYGRSYKDKYYFKEES